MKHTPNNAAEQAFIAAKYFYEMADYFYSLYSSTNKEEYIASFHQYRMKAGEAEKYAELMVQEAIKGNIGIAPEWVRDNFIALNPHQINNEINRAKAYKRGEISEAEIISEEAVKRDMSQEDLRDEEIAILTTKEEARKKEATFVTIVRSEMFELIEKGEKDTLAKLLSEHHFKWNDYSKDRAYRFINLFIDQYDLAEPAEKLKSANVTEKMTTLRTQMFNNKAKKLSPEQRAKAILSAGEMSEIEKKANRWSVTNIPIGKYIHAEYVTKDGRKVSTYLKRSPARPLELYKGNKFKCYLEDVLKWRTIFKTDKHKEFSCLKKNNFLRD